MSESVDERIVRMQFDNKQFMEGIDQSLQSLEKLDESLNMDDSIQKLNSSNLSKFSSTLKTIGSQFNVLETGKNLFNGLKVAVDGFIDKVPGLRKIVDVAELELAFRTWQKIKSTISSITIGQVSAGFGKYTTLTKAEQTIKAALPDTDMEEITDQLAILNKYTDDTSYDFAAMVSTIGKFTANGIGLKESVDAMRGIGNEAAKSGAGIQEANRAMYNFSQALATGSVKLIDWKSIENANMATKEFKQTIIDTAVELGVLKKAGDKITTKKGTAVDFAKFNATLNEGWFTSDVLINTLQKYADTSTDFGMAAFEAAKKALTFEDALNAIKDAVSTQWMRSFESLFGNLEESGELWTMLCDSVIEVTGAIGDYRNELLEAWHDSDVNGRATMLSALIDIVKSLWSVVLAVRDAFAEFIPPITIDTLTKATAKVREFADNLKELLWYEEAVSEEEEETVETLAKIDDSINKTLEKGASGDGVKKLQEQLIALGYDLGPSLADGIYGDKTKSAIEKFQKSIGVAVTGIWDPSMYEKMFSQTAEKSKNILDETLTIGSKGEGVKRLQERLIELGYGVGKAGADGIFGKDTLVALEKLQNELGLVGSGIYNPDQFDAIFGDELKFIYDGTENLEEAGENTEASFSSMVGSIKGIVSGLIAIFKTKYITPAITTLKTAFTIFKALLPLLGGLVSFAGVIGDIITKVTKAIPLQEWLLKAVDWLTKLISPLTDGLARLGEWFGSFFGLKDDVEATTSNMTTFAEVLQTIKDTVLAIWQREDVQAIVSKVVAAWETIKSTIINAYNTVKKYLVDKFNYLFTKDENGISPFLELLSKVTTTLLNTFTKLTSGISKFIDIAKNFFNEIFEKYGLKEKFEEFKEKFSFENIKNQILNVINTITSIWEGTGSEEDGLSLIDRIKAFFKGLYDTVKEWIIGKAASISEKASEIGTKIGEFISGIKDWFTNKLPNGVSTGISTAGGVISKVFNFFKTVVVSGYTFLADEKPLTKVITFLKNALVFVYNNIVGIFQYIKDILPYIGWIANSVALISVARNITKATANISSISEKVADIVNKNTEKVDPPKTETFASKLLKIGGALALIGVAIGLIAGSIYYIGQMDPEQLKQGAITIGAIALGLVAVMVVSKILGGKKGKFNGSFFKMGEGFLAIGGTLLLIALSIVAFALIPKKALIKGGIAVAAVMAALGVFAVLVGKFGGNKLDMQGLIQMAGAIAILAGVVLILGFIPMNRAIKGILGLAAICAILGGTVALISRIGKTSNFKISGLLKMSLAIGILALIVKSLGGMETGQLVKGLAAVTAIGAVIALISFVFGKYGRGKNFISILPIALALAAVIWAMTQAILMIQNVDPDIVYGFAAALGGIGIVLAALAAVFSVASKAGSFKMMKSAVAIGVSFGAIIAIVGSIVWGLGELNELLGGKIASGIKEGAEVLGSLAEALSPLFNSYGGIVIGIMMLFSMLSSIKSINPGKVVQGAAAISFAFGIIIVAIGSLVLGLGELENHVDGGMIPTIQNGGKVLNAVAEALSQPFGKDLKTAAIAAGAFLVVSEVVGKIPKGASAMVKGSSSISFAFIVIGVVLTGLLTGIGYLNESISIGTDGNGDPIGILESGAQTIAKLTNAFSQMDIEPAVFAAGVILVASEVVGKIPGGAKAMISGSFSIGVAFAIISAVAIALIAGIGSINDNSIEGDIGVLEKGADTIGKLAVAFSKMDLTEILTACGVVLAVGTVIGLIPGGAGAAFLGTASVSIAFGIIVAVATGLVVGLGKITEYMDSVGGEGAFISLIETGGAVLLSLGKALGNIAAGVIDSFLQPFKDFMTSYQTFAVAISSLDSKAMETNFAAAIAFAGSLHLFFSNLSAYSFTGSELSGYATPAAQLSTDMVIFATGISLMNVALSSMPDSKTVESGTMKAIAVAEQLHNFFSSLVQYPINSDSLDGYYTAPAQLSTDMQNFASAIDNYKTAVADLSLENILIDTITAITMAKTLKSFFDEIAAEMLELSFTELAKYNTAVSGTFADITEFGNTMAKFKENIAGVSDSEVINDTTVAIAAADNVAAFISKLGTLSGTIEKEQQGITAWFGEGTVQSTVFTNLVDFSSSISTAADNISGISGSTAVDDMEAAKTMLESMVGVINTAQTIGKDENGLYDTLGLATAIEGINQVGISLNTFAYTTENIDTERLSSLATSLSQISDFVTAMVGVGGGSTAAESILGFINGMNSIHGMDLSFDSKDASNVNGFMTNIENAFKDHLGTFTDIGYNISSGVALGIRNGSYLALNAINSLSQRTIQLLREKLGIHSPSTVFEEIGRYMDLGMAGGITAGEADVSYALNGLNSLIMSNIDSDPVIRPVIDMSSVNHGASMIDSMLNTNRSLAIGASINASSVNSNARRSSENQKGASVTNYNDSNTVSVNGNNFYVREEADVQSIAEKIAAMMKKQNRSLGKQVSFG